MKTTILFVLLLISLRSVAQVPHYGFSALVGTIDKGGGILFENKARKFYASVSVGAYNRNQVNMIANHVKLSGGKIWYLPTRDINVQTILTVGGNLHTYGKTDVSWERKVLYPVSIEAGAGMLFFRKIRTGFFFDPMKIEGQFIVGIYFK